MSALALVLATAHDTDIGFSVGGAIVGLIAAVVVYLVLDWIMGQGRYASRGSTVAAAIAVLVFLVCAFTVTT